ncbi:SMR family transporter [Brucella pseudogrignonensis]|uniref:DMT family transporter n=1 Tax=Brucella pseudogrignonensis TaxID=419475 RepID=UPI00190BAABC|nr:SMR family transporter [Brucella pseudogrignonensis]MBK0020404.1 EamA family transporter [Ochrobactrum sp. S45]MBK0042856.1 EamA family transporter [Ochrobactrum sp. S46]UKK91877.1 SMR family transporter [Brucella pseudogrignonensis]
MKNYLFLGVAIVAEVIATSALKASNSFTVMVPTFTMIVGYAVAFYFLSLTLQTVPVGVAYAIWSGCGIVLISAFGWLVYGQKLDLWGMIGIGFIVFGVLIVNLLSKSSVH